MVSSPEVLTDEDGDLVLSRKPVDDEISDVITIGSITSMKV